MQGPLVQVPVLAFLLIYLIAELVARFLIKSFVKLHSRNYCTCVWWDVRFSWNECLVIYTQQCNFEAINAIYWVLNNDLQNLRPFFFLLAPKTLNLCENFQSKQSKNTLFVTNKDLQSWIICHTNFILSSTVCINHNYSLVRCLHVFLCSTPIYIFSFSSHVPADSFCQFP